MTKKKEDPGPIVSTMLDDWCDMTCPCGATHCGGWEGRRTGPAWLKEHAPHSNGMILRRTDPSSWAKFCAGPPPKDKLEPIPKEGT